MLELYAQDTSPSDPEEDLVKSSIFIFSLKAGQCKFGTPECLKNNLMVALMQELLSYLQYS